MRILLLGTGKTGSLVAEVARQRGHAVETLRSADNRQASALTNDRLSSIDTIIDFTTPHCVLENIHAAIAAGKNMVVGTTGWYGELPNARKLVRPPTPRPPLPPTTTSCRESRTKERARRRAGGGRRAAKRPQYGRAARRGFPSRPNFSHRENFGPKGTPGPPSPTFLRTLASSPYQP